MLRNIALFITSIILLTTNIYADNSNCKLVKECDPTGKYCSTLSICPEGKSSIVSEHNSPAPKTTKPASEPQTVSTKKKDTNLYTTHPEQNTAKKSTSSTVTDTITDAANELTDPNAGPTLLSERAKNEEKTDDNTYAINLYKPTYILPGYYTGSPYNAIYQGNTPDNQKLDHLEFKSQISLQFKVFKHILQSNTSFNLGYTQVMYWQFYAKSQYFRETNYEPEAFFTTPISPRFFVSYGLNHQSNGRGGDLERSWNRTYADLQFSNDRWYISLKPWVLIAKAESSDLHNSDIKSYLGNGRIVAAYKLNKSTVSLMSRNNIQSGFSRGALELNWSYHINGHVYLFSQVFSGYGQSLIEYDHFTNAVGIGIGLNNWV